MTRSAEFDARCSRARAGSSKEIGLKPALRRALLIVEKMTKAEGIILGSPVYFTDVTAEMKALIDRAGFVSMANGGMYKNKVGAVVVAVRRSGAIHTLDTMSHFFLAGQMIIIGRGIGVGRDKGEVEKDEEGMQSVKALGQRMAWLLKKL